jgi:hypothetical protein
MNTFNLTRVLAGAATAVALTIAVSGSAFAHGGGMGGGGMGGHIGGTIGHDSFATQTTNNGGNKLGHLGDRRRLRFFYVNTAPGCIYRWTELGRVRICPDYY